MDVSHLSYMKLYIRNEWGWLRADSFDQAMKSLKTDNIIHDVIVCVSGDPSIDLEIQFGMQIVGIALLSGLQTMRDVALCDIFSWKERVYRENIFCLGSPIDLGI
jgi:hypothetical protein